MSNATVSSVEVTPSPGAAAAANGPPIFGDRAEERWHDAGHYYVCALDDQQLQGRDHNLWRIREWSCARYSHCHGNLLQPEWHTRVWRRHANRNQRDVVQHCRWSISGEHPAGTSLQLSATGTFSDSSQQDLSTQVSWASQNIGVVVMSRSTPGLAVSSGAGSTTVTASKTGVSGTTSVVVTGP